MSMRTYDEMIAGLGNIGETLTHFNEKHDAKGRFAKKNSSSDSKPYSTPHDDRYSNLLEEKDTYKRAAQKAWSRYEYQMKTANEMRAAGVPDDENKWLGYAEDAKKDAEYYDHMVSVYENERIPVVEQAIEDYRKAHNMFAIRPKKTLGEKISDAYKNVSKEAKTKLNSIIDKVSASATSGKHKLDSAAKSGKDKVSKAVDVGMSYLKKMFQ